MTDEADVPYDEKEAARRQRLAREAFGESSYRFGKLGITPLRVLGFGLVVLAVIGFFAWNARGKHDSPTTVAAKADSAKKDSARVLKSTDSGKKKDLVAQQKAALDRVTAATKSPPKVQPQVQSRETHESNLSVAEVAAARDTIEDALRDTIAQKDKMIADQGRLIAELRKGAAKAAISVPKTVVVRKIRPCGGCPFGRPVRLSTKQPANRVPDTVQRAHSQGPRILLHKQSNNPPTHSSISSSASATSITIRP